MIKDMADTGESRTVTPPSDTEDVLERTFGWWDMWTAPEDDPREQGEVENTEKGVLVRFLRDYRLTLQMKCADLDAEQMARRSVPPSNLSLLGLVRHLADVERSWFRRRLAGEDAAALYGEDTARGDEFDDARPVAAEVEEAWTLWREEVACSEAFVDSATDLSVIAAQEDATGALVPGAGDPMREILVHVIEEYARHVGHADFLRERIDGRIGQ